MIHPMCEQKRHSGRFKEFRFSLTPRFSGVDQRTDVTPTVSTVSAILLPGRGSEGGSLSVTYVNVTGNLR
jgi:hypothetical protein